MASFKDDVKDFAQTEGCWATLRTPATTLEEIILLNPTLNEEEQKALYDSIHGKWQRDSTLLFGYIKPCLQFNDDQFNQTDIDHIRENFTSLETSARDGPGLYFWCLTFSDPTKHDAQMLLKRKVFDFAVPITTDLKGLRLGLNALVRNYEGIVGNSLTNRAQVAELWSHIVGTNLSNGTRTGFPITPINHPLVLTRLRLTTALKDFIPTSDPPFQSDECANVKAMIEELCIYAGEAGLTTNTNTSANSPAVFGIQGNSEEEDPKQQSGWTKLKNNCNCCDASCCNGNVRGGGRKNCVCAPENDKMTLSSAATRGQKGHVEVVRAYWKQNSHLNTLKNMSITISRISKEDAEKRKAAKAAATPANTSTSNAGASRSVNATIRVDAMNGFINDPDNSLSSDDALNTWLNGLGTMPGIHMNIRSDVSGTDDANDSLVLSGTVADSQLDPGLMASEAEVLRMAMIQMQAESELVSARADAAERALKEEQRRHRDQKMVLVTPSNATNPALASPTASVLSQNPVESLEAARRQLKFNSESKSVPPTPARGSVPIAP